MKQGVEKPHSDTQGQFCSTATQSKLCEKTRGQVYKSLRQCSLLLL